ncbi:DUF934 domain-containing protein [Pseudothauera nasutitermitis]|uniref:DUF934 domain-containing protein n=1 Tax=Pseudothauera nasutitermitis TaxID=2565930 RepID=A0A4S4AT14_9RHOO|nr:DUF934 domain-containing protein [Pseudothauera nasutitermitis]THF62900.1 DUF934 domain-containing protein [Pseudothauera nasutitermitis]
MAEIIRNGAIHADDWEVLRLEEGQDPAAVDVPAGRRIVPLAVWRAQREALAARAEAGVLGVWLAGDEDPAELAGDFTRLALIAVDFPKFADGRGYSIATLLRSRLGYGGELRAIGNVLRDQFFFYARCGFDVFQPPSGRYSAEQLRAALASLRDFSEPYQGAVDREPLFRRAQRGAPA